MFRLLTVLTILCSVSAPGGDSPHDSCDASISACGTNSHAHGDKVDAICATCMWYGVFKSGKEARDAVNAHNSANPGHSAVVLGPAAFAAPDAGQDACGLTFDGVAFSVAEDHATQNSQSVGRFTWSSGLDNSGKLLLLEADTNYGCDAAGTKRAFADYEKCYGKGNVKSVSTYCFRVLAATPYTVCRPR